MARSRIRPQEAGRRTKVKLAVKLACFLYQLACSLGPAIATTTAARIWEGSDRDRSSSPYMTLEGTSGGVAGRSGDSHPAEQGSWKDDPLADPFPPSFDGASTWPDTSDERGEPALGSRGVTFADEPPLPDLDRPPLPTSPERSEVLPQSRHGKNLRRALRCGLCTAVFCSLVGSVLLLEALLLATDSVSAGGSNVTLAYARKSLV